MTWKTAVGSMTTAPNLNSGATRRTLNKVSTAVSNAATATGSGCAFQPPLGAASPMAATYGEDEARTSRRMLADTAGDQYVDRRVGQLEERLGNKAAARRHYEAGATARQPNGKTGAVQLWQSWARMEQRLGEARTALRLYERARSRRARR